MRSPCWVLIFFRTAHYFGTDSESSLSFTTANKVEWKKKNSAVDNEENDVIGKTLHDIWREAIKQRKSETKEEERGREERKLAEYKIKGDKHNNRMPVMNTCI